MRDLNVRLKAPHERLRAQLHAWLGNVPSGPAPNDAPGMICYLRAWHERLHDAGWSGIGWSASRGGMSASAVAKYVYYEELARAGVPRLLTTPGIAFVGPVLMAHGTEAQRDAYLPRILSGEDVRCLGLSEEDAGSDLAGERVYDEVSFEEVVVPANALIGPRGGGWGIAMGLMELERADQSFANHMELLVLLGELVALAESSAAGIPAGFRDRAVAVWTKCQLFRAFNLHTSRQLDRGQRIGAHGSVIKAFWTQLYQDVAAAADAALDVELVGDDAWSRRYLDARATSIFSGTLEIQRDIIGGRIAGLPRHEIPRGLHELRNAADRARGTAVLDHVEPSEAAQRHERPVARRARGSARRTS